MADSDLAALDNYPALLECVRSCHRYLLELRDGNAVLVTDSAWRIMKEYRANIPRGGFANDVLNTLQKAGRVVLVPIDYDDDGYAILPPGFGLERLDPADRKFAAVALRRRPHPPIVNAADSDWTKNRAALAAVGLRVIELCRRLLRPTG